MQLWTVIGSLPYTIGMQHYISTNAVFRGFQDIKTIIQLLSEDNSMQLTASQDFLFWEVFAFPEFNVDILKVRVYNCDIRKTPEQ